MPRHPRLIGATLLLVASSAALAPARPVDAATKPVLAKRTILQVTPQGRITQLAIDPRNTGTLYAGTNAAGIYRSANGGATWALAAQGLPAQGAIAALAVDPANSRTLYAATRVGVYKSVNGGGSWSSEGPPTAAPSTSLALDPLARDTIYAGTGGDGIYRSTNGGATWSAIGPRLATVQVLATDPISPTILYAGTDDGLLIGDAGGTWRRAGLGNVAIRALAIGRPAAADPALFYAGTSTGVLRSTDGGGSWARVGLAALAVDVLHVDATDPRTVYAGGFDGAGLYRSSDAGRHWRRLTAGLGSPNVAALAFDPGDPRVAYAGLDHGVFKTLQAGASWASSSIYDRSVYALLQAGSTGGASYAGTNGGVYTSTDGGTVWTSAGIGNHTVRALLGIQGALLAATESGIYRTIDGGHSWPVTLRYPAFALLALPGAAGGVLAGTGIGLLRSEDGGAHWSALSAGSGAIDALLIGPGGAIYAGGAAGVLISRDAGTAFTRYSVGGRQVVQFLYQVPLPGAPDLLYARTGDGRIYRSGDSGKGWLDSSVGDAQASALTLDADGKLYAATGSGIYRSSSHGISWILTDQQDTSLRPLVLQPIGGAAPATLLEGLDGQGVIVRALHTTPASPFASLVGGAVGRYYAQTGHFVRAPFLDWYAAHNGDAVFGLPRTEAMREGGRLVQYFQNALLVYHPELADTPRVIEPDPLGQQSLGATAPRIASFDNTTSRRYFPQTGHSLSGEFLAYWRAYGGVVLFGPPIGEPLTLNGTGMVVQYFQNVRLEAAPGAPSQFYATQLSPLGDLLIKQKGWAQ